MKPVFRNEGHSFINALADAKMGDILPFQHHAAFSYLSQPTNRLSQFLLPVSRHPGNSKNFTGMDGKGDVLDRL